MKTYIIIGVVLVIFLVSIFCYFKFRNNPECECVKTAEKCDCHNDCNCKHCKDK